MTCPVADDLSSARIRQLLAAIGSMPEPGPATGAVAPYDWRDPHYFNGDQLNRLAQVFSRLAPRLAGTFAHFHNGEFEVSVASITQHFAEALRGEVAAGHGYYLTFGPEKGQPCGFAMVSPETARAWVTLLLGDSESGPDPARTFSSLEESLLCDLAAAVVEGFLGPLRPQLGLKSDGQLSQGQPSIQFELTQEICKVVFQVKNTDGSTGPKSCVPGEIAFLLPCSKLANLAEKAAPAAARVGPSELSRALMEHLQQMPVTVTARLATTNIRFQEMLDLGRDDIVMLDKPLAEPVELIIDGRPAFRGRVARADGRYAVFVTESEAGCTQGTAATKATK
jgi:flagellar motor switch protein FliM